MPPIVLIPVSVIADVPVHSGLLHAYEVVFAVACFSTAILVGALREAESSARVRARELSRRTIDTESDVRRRLAVAIHDGPIQELTSVELMLASAEQALERGDTDKGRTRPQRGTLSDPRERLLPARRDRRPGPARVRGALIRAGGRTTASSSGERRYGIRVKLEIAAEPLPPEVAGPLFRITQEAVANVGKHAQASTVTVRLRCEPDSALLEVEDDGRGFGDVDPLGPIEPGHIGLASMRERAEMLGGELAIDSDGNGTRVSVRAPL